MANAIHLSWTPDGRHTIVQAVLRVGEKESDVRIGTGYNMVEALESLTRNIKLYAIEADELRMRRILGVG